MIKTINHIKNNRTLYLAFGFTIVFFIYLTSILTPFGSCFKLETGASSLGVSFTYTLEMVQKFFEARNNDQLICYGKFLQLWDAIFAFIYTLMYATWIIYFFKNKRLFLIVPILCMIADWTENYIEFVMLKTYLNSGSISATLVSIGSGINSFKWMVSSGTYLIIILGIIIKLKTGFTKSKLDE